MRVLFSTLAASALLCLPAVAQNASMTMQNGTGNRQMTMQSGQSSAVTVQFGNRNSATTVQTGQHTYSSIVQIGDDHDRTNVLNESYSAMGSVQVDAVHPAWSSTVKGGSGGGVTLHFEVK